MSRRGWLPWAVLCLTAAGCATGGKTAAVSGNSRMASIMPPQVTRPAAPQVTRPAASQTANAPSALSGNDRQAEIAWRSGPSAAGYKLPTDYERGWKEGYVDYLTYGNSGDPRVAQRTRTSSSEDWLAGFRDGMTSAYTAVAMEYPTLVAAAQAPINPNALPEVEYRGVVSTGDPMPPAVAASQPLPQPPTPPVEKRLEPTASREMFQPPPLPPKPDVNQPPAAAPPSAPRRQEPYTRMASSMTSSATPAGFSDPQGMPLPGGLKADEVAQSQIWATGQQPWSPQQPQIVRLPDTGESR